MPYTIDGSAGSVPQQVLDYYKSRAGVWAGGGQNSFTDAQGFSWIPIGEDDGIWRGSDAFGRELPITGFRRAQQAGSEASKIGENDHYFKPDGSYSHTSQNEKVESGLQQLAQLAAAVGGIGFLGAAAGVPMGFGGAGAGASTLGATGISGATNGAFLGEGVMSGIGPWDLAMTNAAAGIPAVGQTLDFGPQTQTPGMENPFLEQPWSPTPNSTPLDFGAPPGAPGGSAPAGTPPPANPFAPQSYLDPKNLANLATSGAGSGLLGPLATLAGAASGSQGQQESATQTQQLPGFLQGPVANDLIPKVQGLLGSQAPAAAQAGQSMMNVGTGLLNQPVAGNGVGQIQLANPTTASNPYATGILDDLQRRSNQMIGQNLQGIRGNHVMGGSLGGSRQGIAESQAITHGTDNFTGQAANLMGGLYNADMNRSLQKYGMDQGFYSQQRGQDLGQVSAGAGLLSTGLDAGWQPLKNAASIYSGFSPFGTKTTTSDDGGGGWQGILGGALSGAALGGKLGWWG